MSIKFANPVEDAIRADAVRDIGNVTGIAGAAGLGLGGLLGLRHLLGRPKPNLSRSLGPTVLQVPSPVYTDPEDEERAQAMSLSKTALTARNQLPWYYPGMLAGGVGGLAGGFGLMNWYLNKRRKSDLQSEVDTARNDYHSALLGQYEPQNIPLAGTVPNHDLKNTANKLPTKLANAPFGENKPTSDKGGIGRRPPGDWTPAGRTKPLPFGGRQLPSSLIDSANKGGVPPVDGPPPITGPGGLALGESKDVGFVNGLGAGAAKDIASGVYEDISTQPLREGLMGLAGKIPLNEASVARIPTPNNLDRTALTGDLTAGTFLRPSEVRAPGDWIARVTPRMVDKNTLDIGAKGLPLGEAKPDAPGFLDGAASTLKDQPSWLSRNKGPLAAGTGAAALLGGLALWARNRRNAEAAPEAPEKKDKKTEPKKLQKAALDQLAERFKTAGEVLQKQAMPEWLGKGLGLYGAFALPLMAGSGIAAYHFTRDRSQNKMIENAIKNRDRQRWARRPPEIYAVPTPVQLTRRGGLNIGETPSLEGA